MRIKKLVLIVPVAILSLLQLGSDGSGCEELQNHVASFSQFAHNSPSWTPDGASVVFGDPLRSGLVSVNADGTNLRSLLGPHHGDCHPLAVALDFSPAVSPDGSQIAFVTRRKDADDNSRSWEIAIVGIDGTGFRVLTRNSSFNTNPAWSPDGSRIAFVRRPEYDDPLGLYSMAQDGSDVRNLAPSIRLSNSLPVWSPDGSRLAFLARENEQEEPSRAFSRTPGVMYTVGADGAGLTRIGEGFGQPAWSPDGRYLAFARLAPDDEIPLTESGDPADHPWDQLVVATSDGSPLEGAHPFASAGRELELFSRAFSPPERKSRFLYMSAITWSPDGSELRFIAPRLSDLGQYDAALETMGVYASNPDGTGLRLTASPVHHGRLSWSPDKSRIALFLGEKGFDKVYKFTPWVGILSADGLLERVLWPQE